MVELERQPRSIVNANRDENTLVLCPSRFGADPLGLDGVFRPDAYHAGNLLQRALDQLVERFASANLQVPPDLVAFGSQRIDELLNPRAVFLRVADEDVGHIPACSNCSYPAVADDVQGGAARIKGDGLDRPASARSSLSAAMTMESPCPICSAAKQLGRSPQASWCRLRCLVDRAVKGRAMHAKKGGGFLGGVAVLVDQAAGVRNLRRGEGRARPELHAAGLGGHAPGSGPVDD